MEEVFPLISGRKYKTQVWVTERVVAEIRASGDCDSIAAKLEAFATVGFSELPDNIFRHEGQPGGGDTWRLAYKNASLFRIVGFVESNRKAEFIAIDAFNKESANGYSDAQKKRMKEISKMKREGAKLWRKRT